MNTSQPPSPLRCDARDDIRRIRDVFAQADYRGETVLERLGKRALTAATPLEMALLLHRTAEGSLLDLLTRLFVVGVPVDARRFAEFVAPVALATWTEMGLVAVVGEMVTARVRVLPYHDLLLVCDAPRTSGAPVDPEYVMGAGTSSNTLVQLLPQRPCESALDLGTGCGVLALAEAAHSRRVVATDLNPRAVNYAAFNALFNGRENVEARSGSLFEPVADEQFDLIASNPPFVISPESRFIFRDGGAVGDELCRRIVSEAPARLREGGYCLLLCNWAHMAGQDWQTRLAGWFDGSECDAWILRSETSDTAKYAALWLSHTEGEAADDAAARFDSWLAYYRRVGIEAISYGIILLRHTSGRAGWVRFDEAPAQMIGACGDDVERGFRLYDWLMAHVDDRGMLDTRFRLAPTVQLDQECSPSVEPPWQVERARLRITTGLAYQGEVDAFVLAVVGGCRGVRTIRELAGALAEEMSLPAEEAVRRLTPVVRKLIERGFLILAGE